MVNRFDTPAKAEGYAKARPPLHAAIVERIAIRAATVLDVGCGAGLSTAPLLKLSPTVYGIDPSQQMVKWANRVAPGAHFAAAAAESLPFRDQTFDIITAAGSLNYADPAKSFPELRRVLTTTGTLAIYDFFQQDFPYDRPPDGAIKITPETLRQLATGFRLTRAESFTLPIVMTHDAYLAFLKTEVSVPDPPEREEWKLFFSASLCLCVKY